MIILVYEIFLRGIKNPVARPHGIIKLKHGRPSTRAGTQQLKSTCYLKEFDRKHSMIKARWLGLFVEEENEA